MTRRSRRVQAPLSSVSAVRSIPTSIAAYVGRTPVVQLTHVLPEESGAALFAKVE